MRQPEKQDPFAGLLYGTMLGALLWLAIASVWVVFH